MRFLLLFSIIFFTSLFAYDDLNISDIEDEYGFDVGEYVLEETQLQEINESNLTQPIYFEQKVLYLKYDQIPKRILKGEIFSVILKTLSTVKNYTYIDYNRTNIQGLEVLNEIPYTQEKGNYLYETFYYLATSTDVKLPDINATLQTDENIIYKSSFLKGEKLNVISLNPKENFSNIIANSFELVEYKTTSYDNTHNILIFVAKATNCDIKAFHLNNVYKQGIESLEESIFDSKITYYAIIDKDIENFSFTYFNLLSNNFSFINIPIIVNDDSVTTQSDLKPKDQSRQRLKMAIAGAVGFVFLLFVLWRKKYIYVLFTLIPIIYIIYLAIPSRDLCIKRGTNIYLLPVTNGTVFETTQRKTFLPKEGKVDKFIKVKLKNEMIGWIKDEDLCSY